MEVTNNAKDDAPVWEDCTAEVKSGANHIFENKTAANGFAFNFRVTAERGASGEGGYINGVNGAGLPVIGGDGHGMVAVQQLHEILAVDLEAVGSAQGRPSGEGGYINSVQGGFQ